MRSRPCKRGFADTAFAFKRDSWSDPLDPAVDGQRAHWRQRYICQGSDRRRTGGAGIKSEIDLWRFRQMEDSALGPHDQQFIICRTKPQLVDIQAVL